MCGMSTGKIHDGEVKIVFGYYGGFLTIETPEGRIEYENANHTDNHDLVIEPMEPGKALNYLSQFSSQELAALIIQLIDNADEA